MGHVRDQWTAEMLWNSPSLAQLPLAFMNQHGGAESGNMEAWQQGALPANYDSMGARPTSSNRAVASGAGKEARQQGQNYGNPSSGGKGSNPIRAVQGWDGSLPGNYSLTASPGLKGAPQQGVQPLPFIGYASDRPAGSRGQKKTKSSASSPTEQSVYAQSSRAVSFNLNTPGTGYPPGVPPQCPATGSAAIRGKPCSRNPANASQNPMMEVDLKLLKSANEIYHEYFLQQLSRGTDASAPSRRRHPPSGRTAARQPPPETKPSEQDGGEAEQMSQDIVDPFQLLAALWSMVPAVEDPKSKIPQRAPAGRAAGADVNGESRSTSGDDSFKDVPQSNGMRRYEVHGGSCNAVDKAVSLTDTKSTKSGSGGSGDGSGSHDDDTPPGSHRSSPSMEAKYADYGANHDWDASGSCPAPKPYGREAEVSTKSTSGGGSGSSDTQSGSHRSSPSVEAKDADSETNEDSKKSSRENGLMVMICNLPNNRHAEDALEVLEALGYTGKYDYFYLPVDRPCMCNKGYGFVHFTRIHDAYTFMEGLEGYRFDHTSSTKALTACVAKRQSVTASLRACMKTPHRLLDGKARGRLMSHHPWLFVNGEYRCLSPSSAYKTYQRMQDSFSGE
jgi:hypothetical protein